MILRLQASSYMRVALDSRSMRLIPIVAYAHVHH